MLGLQRLKDHLGQTFCRAHDVGWTHRLVRTDEQEIGHTIGNREADEQPRGSNVIADSFQRIVLDHGHMLVGGGVEDRIGPPGRNDVAQATLVVYRGEERQDFERHRLAVIAPAVMLRQFVVDSIQIGLAGIDQQQRRGFHCGHLTA